MRNVEIQSRRPLGRLIPLMQGKLLAGWIRVLKEANVRLQHSRLCKEAESLKSGSEGLRAGNSPWLPDQ